ncbi:MAG TPA: helix-turn-helix domain-containing protein [Bryobacteraceae bacterium]|jgi:AraC-like DNA-binding protein|nr:helix-turn-helix domain-containing protein [Bryobacteraceae bacterium]
MVTTDFQRSVRFRDHDQLCESLSAAGLALDVFKNRSTPLDVEIAAHAIEGVKIVKVSGDPARVSRGRTEISSDDGAFLAVLFQKSGRTVCDPHSGQTILDSGDLLVWYGRRSVSFEMPETFQKVCLFVPFDTFEGVLPESKSYVGAHLPQRDSVSRLLGNCLSTLADEVLTNDSESAEAAVELTLGLLGAALTQHRESNIIGPRTDLYQRITSFVEKGLEDPELSPMMLARTHHISTRYVHLIFNERGKTVGAWIRERRLAQCRAELANSSRDRSVTEIALHWGFSDLAHFSRSFHSAYGVSPLKFRNTRRASGL